MADGFTLSQNTFSNIGGAVSDLFGAQGAMTSAQGAEDEAKAYKLASGLAKQNQEYTQESTAVQEMQQNRVAMQAQGSAQADVAGAGFSNSGSGLDILRSNASQAALASGVMAKQGAITEAGYQEQAQSYSIMSDAAMEQAKADKEAASGDTIGAILKVGGAIVGGVAGFMVGGPVGAAAGASLGSSL